MKASGWDCLAIVGWLAGITVVGFGVRRLLPPVSEPLPTLAFDGVAIGLTVLPAWVYLTATEGTERQATWGKRRTRIEVVTQHGGRPSLGAVMARNAVKLLPWQLAHIAVARIILERDAPVTIWTTYSASLLIPIASSAMSWRDPLGRALHDRIAGTRVVRTARIGSDQTG